MKNVEINQANWAKYPNSIKVNELDWEKGICYSEERMTQLNSPFNFSKEDIEEIKQTKIFLAADGKKFNSFEYVSNFLVIYDYFLTNSFFKLVDQLLSFQQDSILYLTVEKRINFCLEGHEFKVCSPFHQHFLTHLFAEKPTFDPKTGVTIPISPFHSRQIEINFPQYFNYERSDRLELWEITKRKKNSTMKKK